MLNNVSGHYQAIIALLVILMAGAIMVGPVHIIATGALTFAVLLNVVIQTIRRQR